MKTSSKVWLIKSKLGYWKQGWIEWGPIQEATQYTTKRDAKVEISWLNLKTFNVQIVRAEIKEIEK